MHETLATDLERLMAELTKQQQEVLTLRYGLLDGKALSLEKVALNLKLSRERVRQIEDKALKELRKQAVLQDY